MRIRVADFEADGSGIGLRDLRAIRFQFGAAWGSARGRLGLDQIEFTRD